MLLQSVLRVERQATLRALVLARVRHHRLLLLLLVALLLVPLQQLATTEAPAADAAAEGLTTGVLAQVAIEPAAVRKEESTEGAAAREATGHWRTDRRQRPERAHRASGLVHGGLVMVEAASLGEGLATDLTVEGGFLGGF